MAKRRTSSKKATAPKAEKPKPGSVPLVDLAKGTVAEPNLVNAPKAEPVVDATPKPIAEADRVPEPSREPISDVVPAVEQAPEATKVTASVAPVTPVVPTHGPTEALFEHPDGRIFVGPKESESILDPVSGVQVMKKR